MSKNRKMYRYRVAEVHEAGQGRVEVGAILVDRWHGKSHTYKLENRGVVKPFCSVELVGEHEKSEAEVRAALGEE